jgi:malate/lactate dehydrogenase
VAEVVGQPPEVLKDLSVEPAGLPWVEVLGEPEPIFGSPLREEFSQTPEIPSPPPGELLAPVFGAPLLPEKLSEICQTPPVPTDDVFNTPHLDEDSSDTFNTPPEEVLQSHAEVILDSDTQENLAPQPSPEEAKRRSPEIPSSPARLSWVPLCEDPFYENPPEKIKMAMICPSGKAGRAFTEHLLSGGVFGPNTKVDLRVTEIFPKKRDGTQEFLQEMQEVNPLLGEYQVKPTLGETFEDDLDFVVIFSYVPRTMPKQSDQATLANNVKLYRRLGLVLATGRVRHVVVHIPEFGHLCAYVLALFAPNCVVTTSSCLQVNRQHACIQKFLAASNLQGQVDRCIAWGGHRKYVPDFNYATLNGKPLVTPQNKQVFNPTKLQLELGRYLKQRSKGIAKIAGGVADSPALGAVKALGDHLQMLEFGTPPGKIASAGVVIKEEIYGIVDLCFSVPVIIEHGEIHIVPNLPLEDPELSQIESQIKSAIKERELALQALGL